MKNKLSPFAIQRGLAQELLGTFERFIWQRPMNALEEDYFPTVPLQEYALQAIKISPTTALHKVLALLAYYDYFLYSYDDVDWIGEPDDFLAYVKEMFSLMQVAPPAAFLTLSAEEAINQRHHYSCEFIRGLNGVADSAYALLWPQKASLLRFNELLASRIQPLKKSEFPQFEADGRLPRDSYIPVWLANAVNYRDRGICFRCGRPVSAQAVPDPDPHLDHMMPLALGGTNDATNFALACGLCNVSMGARRKVVEDLFHWQRVDYPPI